MESICEDVASFSRLCAAGEIPKREQRRAMSMRFYFETWANVPSESGFLTGYDLVLHYRAGLEIAILISHTHAIAFNRIHVASRVLC